MSKTLWQDPGSSEILSTYTAGLQEAVGKIEDVLDLQTAAETDAPLIEVYISEDDRYRIYQVAGKRNWVAEPTPVIKKNGVVIASGYMVDYGGGAVIFNPRLSPSDTVTASFTHTTGSSNKFIPAPAGSAQGDVLVRKASGWARLAPGTPKQVLTTQGAGADPLWANVSSGATTIVVGTPESRQQVDFVVGAADAQTVINQAINELPVITWETGTARAGSSSPDITLATTASGVDDFYVGYSIEITAGTGAGQSKVITDYTGASKVAVVDSPWTTVPNTTSQYAIKSPVGRVSLLEGLYLISGSIELPTNVILDGQGPGTVIKADGGGFAAIANTNATTANRNIEISNLTIDGPYAGVGISQTTHVRIQNLSFKGIDRAIDLNSCKKVQITNCQGYNAGYSSVYLDGVEDAQINNNIFMVCGYASIYASEACTGVVVAGNTLKANAYYPAVYIECDNALIANNICMDSQIGISCNGDHNRLAGNLCTNCAEKGISISGAHNIVANNTINGTSAIGIYLNSEHNIVQGNIVNTGSEAGISGTGFNDISGNQVTGAGTGIKVEALNFVVRGNRCRDNTQQGIYLINGAQGVIEGNHCVNNGTEGILIGDGSDSIQIVNNFCAGNSKTTANTSANIQLSGSRLNVQGNTCRVGDNAPKYGIRNVAASGVCLITNNDCFGGGTTAGIADAGSGSVYGAGNRNNNGTFSATPG